MAPIKRKSGPIVPQPDAASRKRPRTEDKGAALKKPVSKAPTTDRKKAAPSKTTPESKPESTLVNSNEPAAFPRGGASLLTPAERKQIQVQATRDVLFEQADKDGQSDSEVASDPEDSDAQTKKSKKSGKKQKKKTSDSSKTGIKIEGLSYKQIAPGSILLGQVSSINDRDVSVSLPNNLTGYVPLTAISPQVTAKIESLLQEQDEEQEPDTEDDIDLKAYVKVGQYLRVYVSSTGESGGNGPPKKHIELSVEPGLCNNGMKQSDIVSNITLQASVHSVEDHGLIMDLGLAEETVRGFVPAKELGKDIKLPDMQPGMVFLCQVISPDSSGRTIKMSLNPSKLADISKNFVNTAPTIDSFLPGTAVEILLTEVTDVGLAGKVMGSLDVVTDMVHSSARLSDVELAEKYSIGQKIKGRLISTFPMLENKKLGFSLMDHIINMKSTASIALEPERPTISQVVPNASVLRVNPGMGVYLTLGSPEIEGFAHISNLSDKKVETISETTGPYKLGSQHEARVTGYSALDNVFLVSLQESVISRAFLRIDDVKVGQTAKGKIQKLLISEQGVTGLLVELAEGITGLVPRLHMSDLQLQHPERKFREGLSVNARVLAVDPLKRQIRLTLKKSLVNSDMECWKSYEDIQIGHTSPGTLVKVTPRGAVVQFFGQVHGFLPVSEMSEAFIKDATQHFREGQVVTVTAINVDGANEKLTVSCRDPSSTGNDEAIKTLKVGESATGTVFEKSEDDLLLRLEGSDVLARLELDHVADGSEKKRRGALSKIRVGQKLQELVILEILEKRRIVRLSNKASLVQAAKDGSLLSKYEDLKEDKKVTGFVANITDNGVFVGFAGGLTGFLTKGQISTAEAQQLNFGMNRLQTVTSTISSIDYKGSVPKFWLTQIGTKANTKAARDPLKGVVVDAVDSKSGSLEDFSVGSVTKARIISVRETQLNVELAKDVQGRIDVSEVFDDWDEIKDRKKPLRQFESKQIITVRILGAHDARNHRFLPLTHRTGKTPVFELSAKPSFVESSKLDILTMDNVKVGSTWVAFVNNIADNYLWVNLSPNVRGRIAAMDITDDLSLLSDLEANFPIGSALKVHVTGVDLEKGRLDFSAKPVGSTSQVMITDISLGMILPGRVTRSTERQLLVQLSENLVGAVGLVDIADDYKEANPSNYQKNEVVRVCVLSVDVPNKKIMLSIRPSRVLSSSLPVRDPEVKSVNQLKINDVRRGFVSNVSEKGVFVSLGHNVTAFVRVANLSDRFIKDWQEHFQRDQLVTGKIIAVDAATGHVQMNLKDSVLKADYKAPLTFNDLEVGQIISGKVAKVEDFGVFIVVDNSSNVRGLCHRSEIAEQRIEDVRKIFNEGDAVKAKVLKVDLDKRRVNFGLKASYFADVDEEEGEDAESIESGMDLEQGGVEFESEDSEDGIELDEEDEVDDEEDSDVDVEMDDVDEASSDSSPAAAVAQATSSGLSVGGFDWVGITGMDSAKQDDIQSDVEGVSLKPKKKKKAEVTVDRTGDLDANGPQSADDFERLLLGEPDSSLLWLQYMAFHLELGDIEQARQIATRAVQTIGIGQDAEKLNIWVAMLNLENTYGDDETMTETFKKACQYNDAEEVHSRLASIYIQSGKLGKADDLFQTMIKKFSQDPKTWLNYATFLFDSQSSPERGRQLLSRALQTLPKHTGVDITSKFAALEFRSSNGDPERGRTIFEGLLDSFPKRSDLWNVLLDLELKRGDKDQVRNLFERIFTQPKLKDKQAKYFFKRWLEFEEKEGDERSVDQVKSKAAEFVRLAREKREEKQ